MLPVKAEDVESDYCVVENDLPGRDAFRSELQLILTVDVDVRCDDGDGFKVIVKATWSSNTLQTNVYRAIY